MDHASRLRALQARLHRPLLVADAANLRYLTGFAGSNGYLAVWPDRARFVTDGRYGEAVEPLVASLPATDLVVYQGELLPALAGALDGGAAFDVEADSVSWQFVRRLGEAVTTELFPVSGLVEAERVTKDEDEVASLRRAARVGDLAYGRLDELIAEAGVEAELGWALVSEMRSHGAEAASWEPIVAAGANASVPHYRSGRVPVGQGLLLLDYGCVVDGYHSDMSRTRWLGHHPDPELERIHAIVAEAQEAAIATVAPGTPARSVDEAARAVLRRYQHEEKFLHSTGHGIGLQIHEAPRLARTSDDLLETGNVITVEPGVYLPGRGGVRIEDMVLVTEAGPVVLTEAPRELVVT